MAATGKRFTTTAIGDGDIINRYHRAGPVTHKGPHIIYYVIYGN